MMMRALIVYESMFGNTEAIAREVASGLSPYLLVEIVPVREAPDVIDGRVGLLVVGGPTHAFSMSRASTRQAAAHQGADGAAAHGIGLREWLATVRLPVTRARTATFDTRVATSSGHPKAPGSAARRAGKRLRSMGSNLVVPPMSFLVSDTAGPLLPGEAERARRWADEIGSLMTTVDAGV